MQKIKSISNTLIAACVLALFVIPVCHLMVWFGAAQFANPATSVWAIIGHTVNYNGELINIFSSKLSTTARIIGFCGNMAADLIVMAALYQFIKLLRHFIQGNVFTAQSIRLIKLISILILIYSLIGVTLIQTMDILAITFDKPAGQRVLSIGFGTPNISLIFYSVVVYLVAVIMGEAQRIKSEQDLTI